MSKKYYLHGPQDYYGGTHQIWGKDVWTIRQTRFKGQAHPHDVMAVGSPEELWGMWQQSPWDSNDVNW